MKVYWKEDGEKIGEDKLGNAIYQQDEKSGILVGSHHVRHSGYPKLLIALENGKFTSQSCYDCYHKEEM